MKSYDVVDLLSNLFSQQAILFSKKLPTRLGQFGEAKVKEKFTWDTRVALMKGMFESCLK